MAYTYIVAYATAATGPWTPYGNPVSSLTDVVTGLAPNINYWFEVIPVDGATGAQGTAVITGPVQVTATIVESASGTVINSPSSTIYDSTLTPWTLIAQTANFQVKHGTTTDLTGVAFLLYYNHVVYAQTGAGAWSFWNGTGYTATGGDPRNATSASGTTVTAVGTRQIIDSKNTVWTLVNSTTNGVQISHGGIIDGAQVTLLLYFNNLVYQENINGGWWYWDTPTASYIQVAGDPRNVTITTGVYAVKNGLIVGPDGTSFIARGVNLYDSAFAGGISNAAGAPVRTVLPRLNFLRIPCYSYNAPSFFQAAIDRCTALGIVVLLEHHQGAGGGVAPLTGSDLAAENAWFSSLATAFKNYSNVWFGTLNEPSGPGTTLTAQQVSNYNTIRATGNTSIVVFQTLGDYPTGILTIGAGHGLTASAYATMTNVIWDVHFYNGLPDFNANNGTNSYSTNQTFENNLVLTYIQQAQTITSADGIMPVIIGEYGVSTDGSTVDPGGTQCCIAVQQSGKGCSAWNWYSGAGSDNITDGNNNLTTYGQQIAAWMAASAPSFQISGGKILTPTGQTFVPKGVALDLADLSFAVSDSQARPLTTLFPGINIVRLYVAVYPGTQTASYTAGSYANIQSYVNILTKLGIVVAINDGTDSTGADNGGGAGVNYTTTNGMLTQMVSYYTSLATGFLNNIYVWFGTRNEPCNNTQGALTIEHQATYNAIRGTGNNTIIEMEQIGGGSPTGFSPMTMGANNTAGLYPNSVYNQMKNIIWGPHFYNWLTNYSTSASVNSAEVSTMANLCQQIQSADGVVPVVFWEYGVGTGATQDAGGVQSATAVQQSGYGAIAWGYDQYQSANSLTNAPTANTLTTWGTQTAAWISS